jgi:hypothetical protein
MPRHPCIPRYSSSEANEWLQTMQYIHPHIKYCYHRNAFMPDKDIPSTGPPVIHENITPVLSTPALVRKGFNLYAKSIVSSKQAKADGFVDFVPVLVSRNRLRISSNQSRLHYAIVDRMNPSKWSMYAPDVTKHYRIKNSWALIAHQCPHTLMKLLLNYAAYRQRGILTFVLLNERFLVYDMPQLLDHSN